MDNTDKHLKDWLKFLDENEVKFQLTTASIYLTAYDLLINQIVERVRDMYLIGFDEDGEIISDDYKTNVRGLFQKDIVIASLLWLKNNDAITGEEVDRIKIFKEHRNLLAHEMIKMISDIEFNVQTGYVDEIKDLYFKLEKWWFVNFEVDLNPDLGDLDLDSLDYNEVFSIKMLPLNYMANIIDDEIEKREKRKVES